MNKSDFKILKAKVVLGIAAHPDDLDFGAAGTMAAFAQAGAAVHYLILTDGSKGTDNRKLSSTELIEIREKEQRAAVKAIGGQTVQFLGYPDSHLEVTTQLKKDIVKVIRSLKPDVVVTMDPTMVYSTSRGFINHPDHRAAGQATLDAVFPLARDHLTFPELDAGGYPPHKTKTVLLVNFDKANYTVDITKTFNNKIEALKAHASQIGDIDQIKIWLKELATQAGNRNGHKLGESFIRIDLND